MTEEVLLITEVDLREICVELDADTSATIFMNSAHTIMFDTYGVSTTFSASRLRLIELYLAAHFATVTYQPTAFAGVGKLQESVQYKLGLGLQNTKYGQQALLLSDGKLLGKKVSISWLGTIPRNYENYQEV